MDKKYQLAVAFFKCGLMYSYMSKILHEASGYNVVKQSEIAPATALCPLPSGAVIISNFMAVSLYTKSSIYKYTAEGENCKHMKQKKRRILPWFGYASLRKTIIT